jgi:formylglycine-generating enzyme required for sulfatase activity
MRRIVSISILWLFALATAADLDAQTPNKALLLNTGGFVQVASTPGLQNPSGITIEGWLYPVENGAVNEVFLGKGDGQNAFSDQSYWLSWSKLQGIPGRTLSFQLFLGSSTWATIAAQNVASNTWTHFATTYDQPSSTLRLFTNGVLAATRTVDAGGNPINSQTIRQSTLPLVFGNQNPVNDPAIAAAGAMDELRIWNRALSAAEILAEYQCGSVADTSLMGSWSFNDGTSADRSGNRNNGKIAGTAMISSPPSPQTIHQHCGDSRSAIVTPVVLNGFIVGMVIVDGGSGYSDPPEVTIDDAQGIGGLAVARVVDGVVTEIVVRNAGSGYSASTSVQVASPRPSLPIETLTVISVSGVPGVQTSVDVCDHLVRPFVWTPFTNFILAGKGSAFIEPPVIPLTARLYRATQAGPANPIRALAAAQVVNGFVVSITVMDSGLGYTESPLVSLVGGGGTGALATAQVEAGTIKTITVANAGRSYTNAPTVLIAPPPAAVPLSLGAKPLRTLLVPAPYPNPDYLKWVWIPPGQFVMGSPTNELARYADEGPQTTVALTRGFWMGRFLVTQKEYTQLMGTNPSWFHGSLDLPVDTITWEEASAYCAKLTAVDLAAGKIPPSYAYRLPTEAEWEYAARAGTSRRYSFGDDLTETAINEYAWFVANSGGTTHVSGERKPNQWGLFDMYGNVWQWCSDQYGAYPGGFVVDPKGTTTSDHHVFRGGSWVRVAADCRAARRNQREPNTTNHDQGFRLVLSPSGN